MGRILHKTVAERQQALVGDANRVHTRKATAYESLQINVAIQFLIRRFVRIEMDRQHQQAQTILHSYKGVKQIEEEPTQKQLGARAFTTEGLPST